MSSGKTAPPSGTARASEKPRVPAIEGWFTLDDGKPHLLAQRCRACATYAFPPTQTFCPNPACAAADFESVPLSRSGTVWSYTDNRYQPPQPYVSSDPFVPYAIAAVELVDERLVVLGQVVPETTGALAVGAPAELVIDTLYEDDEHAYVTWKWSVGA